jgi:cytochrome c-type biogenesis protein
LIFFSFLAGIVTILSPCILPILPIILSSTIGDKDIGKGRPLGIVLGFIASFTFFTLFLTVIVKALGVPAATLRLFSVFVIALFGASLLIPRFQAILEVIFSKISKYVPQGNSGTGFLSGVFIGFSIGLLWTPCVGPILASVITLAISGEVTFASFLITFSYSLGTALPMFAILIGGQNLIRKNQWLLKNTSKIQRFFGLIMIFTAIAIWQQWDRRLQSYILETFPNYSESVTFFERNTMILNELRKMK